MTISHYTMVTKECQSILHENLRQGVGIMGVRGKNNKEMKKTYDVRQATRLNIYAFTLQNLRKHNFRHTSNIK